ncbi:MAG: NAD-dependent epimerase/dehydratase family protein [Spirochaetes bacterium]|jgi:nucleoside-diphosphate-sugar epimerase|nr:NAD-dependent epimerase/dehydratase family protein [Spirochaetota bacterium]
MRIFITGGTGFIGRHLIPRLIQKRHKVTAVGRTAHALSKLEIMGATPVSGNLRSVSTFTSNFSKADAVIHIAGKNETWGSYKDFYELNIRASEEITGAASYHGVKKLIYVSTASVVCTGKPLYDIDEEYNPIQLPSDSFTKSKAIAEARVREISNRLNTVILRPPLVWGKKMTLIEQLRRSISRIGFPLIGKPGHQISTCHVENLVEAIVIALDKPETSGTFYVTDGEALPIRIFIPSLLLTHGLFAGRMRMPKWAAMTLASILEAVWSITPFKSSPPLTRTLVNLFGTELTVRDNKIREILGYQNRVNLEDELQQRRY